MEPTGLDFIQKSEKYHTHSTQNQGWIQTTHNLQS
jgi:hypothetical protein